MVTVLVEAFDRVTVNAMLEVPVSPSVRLVLAIDALGLGRHAVKRELTPEVMPCMKPVTMAVSAANGVAAAAKLWLVCTAAALALGTETMLWVSRRINANAPVTNSVGVGKPPPVPDGARPSRLENPDTLAATAPVGAAEVAVAETARRAERTIAGDGTTGALTATAEPIGEDEFDDRFSAATSSGVP